ncbi:hypothetical protein ACGFMM_01425 [Streptomyces sp. NPDC048604]|uniref:hypothetical protein n=1 Tax=Streptomyces sp. NPDC048604 TaxID=3365578 RepID=UPI0037128DB5
MRRTTLAALIAAGLLALTACSSSASTASADKPATTAPSPSPSKTYTYEDCVALLEYDYQQGKPQDASKDPECAHLTNDQYVKAVGEVLTAHKDEILEDAATQEP